MKSLIGVPSNKGINIFGTQYGPSYFREFYSLEKDYGDFTYINSIENTFYHALQYREFPVLIGGDHYHSVGSITAVNKRFQDFYLIWIDAHADFNNTETSLTGNLHGMPLNMLVSNGVVREENIFLVEPRAIDPLEQKLLDQSRINVVTAKQLLQQRFDKPIHVSFDVDCLDPTIAPGVSVPEKNGLSIEQVVLCLDYLWDTQKVKSLDIMELNPLTDKNNITIKNLVKIFRRYL